ncbi:hypothetical protein ABT186_28755 [Streptomyces sp. NPDC001634]|uniref:hypothetical protein n=1 Tax=Streptomyces sp. NPDC001634 TaxID=3154390 RepID=UPI00332A8C9E
MAGRIFTAAVTVPTQLRGDLLATMGTTYVDGTNAGPADWPPSAARPSSCAARGLVPSPHSGVHRDGTNPPRTDAEPPEPCASTR